MDMGSNKPTAIRTYLQAIVQQSTPEKTGTSSESGLWRPKTGDHTYTPAAGAAAPEMEEGSAPPSPIPLARALILPRQLVGCWFVSRVCLWALRCWLLVVQLLLTWWELGKRKLGWAAGQSEVGH
jgi:hypothetical protein